MFLWFWRGDQKAEIESYITAAHHEAIQTKYLCNQNNDDVNGKCRLFQQFDVTVDHIISACRILVK